MQNTEQVIDDYYTFLKQRNREKLHGLLSSDLVVTYHSQPNQFPWSGKFHGIEGFDDFFSKIQTYLNIVEVTIVDSTISENKMVNQCEGSWEYKANGYRVNGSMVNVFTISAGKISAYDVYADTAAFAAGFPA
jgi:ketosteroid isomerase-like protein